MNKSLFCILWLAILVSCSKGYDEVGCFKNVDAEGWNYGDNITFDVVTSDSAFTGDIALVVRNTSAYEYSNLWLELSYLQGDSTVTDTVNFRLADIHGDWLGKGLGLSFQRVDTVLRNIKLDLPTTVNVRHIMRVDCLENIEQLGLILIPQNND